MVTIRDDIERIALGGLLHDIGKFIHRSKKYSDKVTSWKHPFLSEYFINFLVENKIINDDKNLREIVKKHHEGQSFLEEINVNGIKDDKNLKKLALIVARADNYSSAERDEDKEYTWGTNDFREVPLGCLFEGVSLGEIEENKKTYNYKYELSTFDYKSIFPKKIVGNSPDKLDRLIDNFLDEILEIKTDDFNTLFVNLMDCIKKYCWCVASDTQKNICDLSLYDHLKTTSAIAVASYNFHLYNSGSLDKITQDSIKKGKSENDFLLIGGDISGIQQYIYALETTENIAKRLRSRSFFIKMLSDVSSYKIIKELGLMPCNIIISSGGKFYILAQNTEETIVKLKEIKKEINKTLYRDYTGQLYLNLEWINLSGDELGLKFSSKYDKLNDKLEEGKGKKFSEEILNENIIENPLYESNEKITLCKICRRELVNEKDEQCKKCEKDIEFGSYLPKMSKFTFYYDNTENEKEKSISLFGVKCRIYEDDEIVEGNPFIVYYYDKVGKRDLPFIQDFYGGYTPINFNGEVKKFEDILKDSKSINLGILKGDVDNLGLIFSIGLKREEEIEEDDGTKTIIKKDVTSISRISTLSRMMDSFFSYWLPTYLEKEEKNPFYVVYAGGDDFMIVGAWEKLISLSKIIQEEFKRFTAESENITLTCGISITKPKDPIYFSSQWATEAEEKGKSSGKNGLVLFDKYIPWKDYEEVFSLADFIDKNLSKGKDDGKIYTQSFLYRLLRYTDMAEKYLNKDTRNGKYLKYISDFTYDVGRNIVPKLKEKYNKKTYSEEEIMKMVQGNEIIRRLTEYFSIETLFDEKNISKKDFVGKYMRVVLNYVVRKNREGKLENE